MKTASDEFKAILALDAFWKADLFVITLLDGTVLRVTNWPDPLTVSGLTYQPAAISLSNRDNDSAHSGGGGGMEQKQGLEVAQLVLDWGWDDTPIVGTLPGGAALRAGIFSRAQIVRSRIVMRPSLPVSTSAGAVQVFSGRFADMDGDRFGGTFNAESDLSLLNADMPRNLYQASCIWTLYGIGCGLTPVNTAGTVSSGATKTVIPCSLSQASGYFNRGKVAFTSGANAGLRRAVKVYTSGSLAIYPALPYVPASGDGFNATPGCDKTRLGGCTFFNNLARFRGYPFVPAPETAI